MMNSTACPRAIPALALAAGSFWAPSAHAQPSAPPAGPQAEASPRPKFAVEPITDGAFVAVSAGFAGLLNLVMNTGEIRPQEIPQTFETRSLLKIDRGAISQRVDPNAALYSNIGLSVAIGYAILDPIATGFREKSLRAALVDGIIYAETLTMTLGVTNLAKIAVRRPRPAAYAAAEAHRDDPNYLADTDSSLSFFSGHASVSAALSATATYLAFVRSPSSPRPWITLIAGTLLTSFISFERVRSGSHFPTDVIAGAMAGAGIGILVPHFHRVDSDKPRTFWFGAVPTNTGTGGTISLSGVF